ncbi:MAG TPA: hypothetical protein VJ746_12615 [Nitrospira sp.]|nr:hypothetical protein [Nitrospira sp.]
MQEEFPNHVWVIVELAGERPRFTISEQDPDGAPGSAGSETSRTPTHLDIICGSEATLFEALTSLGFLPPPAAYFRPTPEEHQAGGTIVRRIPPPA